MASTEFVILLKFIPTAPANVAGSLFGFTVDASTNDWNNCIVEAFISIFCSDFKTASLPTIASTLLSVNVTAGEAVSENFATSVLAGVTLRPIKLISHFFIGPVTALMTLVLAMSTK